MAGPYAFVTLVSSDSYLPGALAQVAALKDVHPYPPLHPEVPFQTVCLVTPESVDVVTIKLLRRAFNLVIGVEILEQENNSNLELLGRPDLATVLTKLHVFRLVQYSKIIFLDADVLPIRPLSHLFNIKHDFAAAPDVGWPDIFNSGVLVLSPGQDKFNQLYQLLKSKGSWDGGDQGLLNEWRNGDWHRLSFTYNTTPTAAYTYAPAYERFGSQINAIHYIGSNKPWKSIPFRSPFQAENKQVSDTSSQQVYDYESLVDRWFAVYDKHYRSQPIISPSFEVKRYSSAWDRSKVSGPSELHSRPAGVFGLEDLRKIAIEGMNSAGLVMAPPLDPQPGEGEYQSMPIEGRFDLIRPRPKQAITDTEGETTVQPDSSYPPEPSLDNFLLDTDTEIPMTPIVPHLDLQSDPPRWQTLPTPGPDEVPPSPKPLLRSLPTTPTSAIDYYASSAGQTSDSEGCYEAENAGDQTNETPHSLGQVSPARQAQSKGGSSPKARKSPNKDNKDTLNDSSGTRDHLSRNGPHTDKDIRRPPSPPLLAWNPAIEPPPTDAPAFLSFPLDTYFMNAWDETHTQKYSFSQDSSPAQPSRLFQAPPPPQIPEVLRKEGHYRNVTGEDALGLAPSPDRSKVKPVFPWEDKPRQFPGRVFPASDAPSPIHFINPGQGQLRAAPPRTAENKAAYHTDALTPLGSPFNLNYSNAWDAIPSIQSYASRLVRPSQPTSPLAPAFADNHRQDKDRENSWDDKLDASSRDGDDEDEGDNDDREGDARELDSDNDRSSRPRLRNESSVIEDTRQVQQSVQKFYHTQGVQTIAREKRSQGVQVSTPVELPERQNRSSSPGKSSVTTPNGASRISGILARPDTTSNSESTRPQTTASSAPKPLSRMSREFITPPPSNSARPPTKTVSTRIPDPTKISTSPRVMTSHRPITPPKISSPFKASTPPTRPSIQTNRHGLKGTSIVSRQISNDSSIGSPASSVGPISPQDDQLIDAPARKGTRVWDPARGVELFKRGSEEVLARFLKMGSWDETSR